MQATKTLPLTVNPQTSGTVLLEDFASWRFNGDGTHLWDAYLGEDPGQTASLDTSIGALKDVIGASPNGVYVHFFPRSGGYAWPNGYAQYYVKSGNFDPLCNRLRFWVKPNKTINSFRSDGGDTLQIGTYIRNHSVTDSAWQGDHYYHLLDANFYANRWHFIEINRQPQHQVGGDPNFNWPEDPDWTQSGVHYFDGLTRFYFDTQGNLFNSSTWWFDDFTFATVPNEPDTKVSSICAVYTGTNYRLTWAGPKNMAQLYDIAYKTSTMKPNSFSSGTSGGSTGNPGSAYTGCVWQSPAMSENSVGMYFAIRPQGGTIFTEVFLPKRI